MSEIKKTLRTIIEKYNELINKETNIRNLRSYENFHNVLINNMLNNVNNFDMQKLEVMENEIRKRVREFI